LLTAVPKKEPMRLPPGVWAPAGREDEEEEEEEEEEAASAWLLWLWWWWCARLGVGGSGKTGIAAADGVPLDAEKGTAPPAAAAAEAARAGVEPAATIPPGAADAGPP
jgi:hypothetical protein